MAAPRRALPQHLRLLLDVLDEPTLLLSLAGEVLDANAGMGRWLGFSDLPAGFQLNDLIASANDNAATLLSGAAASGGSIAGALIFRRSDGAEMPCRAVARQVQAPVEGESAIICLRCQESQDRPSAVRDAVQDSAAVFEREAELRRLNWALAAYAGSSTALVRSNGIDDLMGRVCISIVAQNSYVLATVVLVEDSPGRPVRQVARAGRAAAYLDGLTLSWAEDRVDGRGPTGLAIRSGLPHIVHDSLIDPEFAPWRSRAEAFGIRSSVTVPFKRDGQVLGALLVYAASPEAFGEREMDLFQRLGDELVFAMTVAEDRARLRVVEAAREEAQRTLLQERDFSQAVLRSLPGVLYAYDENGRFLRWNQRFESVTGRSGQEIAQMRPTDFFAGEDRKRVQAAIAAVFETGEANIEADFLAKDGTPTPFYFTGVSAQLEGRNCLIGIGIDFTERRKSEAARLKSEARYRTLFEYAPDGIIIADAAGSYIDINPSMCRLLGFDYDELLGRSAADIVVSSEVEHIAPALRDIKAKADYHREWQFRRKDGSILSAEVIATVMPDGHVLAMVRDQTERKLAEAARLASEARYRALFESAPEGILVANPDGEIIDANATADLMLGYEPGGLIGKRGADIVALTELAEIPLAFQTLASQGIYRREWILRRKDGSTFPAEVVSAMKPTGNRLGMIRDMTERNQAEEARRAAEEKARDASAELARFSRVSTMGELVATIAHEINQPLAAIVTNSDAAMRWLAKSPPNFAETRQALRRITRDSNRAHEVIKRTRAFLSRGEPDHGDVDINEAIEEIVTVTRREQRNARVVVEKCFSSGLPPARGNRTQLQQVILNLVLNGMDAMRSIRDRDNILTIRTSAGNETIMVSVEDTGTGLNPQTADRLFEHFFTSKPEGTGLGLAISKSIVEAHGGRLWAAAGTPYGAIFQFTVPCATGARP